MENEHMIFDDSYFMKEKKQLELTDADRERIEQEAQHFAKGWGENCDLKSFKAGAEYSTLYERQQENLAYELELAASDILSKEVKRLEAEHAELRNKVIDEIQQIILGFATGLLPEEYEGKKLPEIIEALKTK